MWKLHGRLPVLFRGDSTLLDENNVSKFKTVFRRLLLRLVYRLTDIALYAGTENKKYFQIHGLKDQQLKWVPHVIDNARFGALTEKEYRHAALWRKELGFTEDQQVLLFAGKLERKKNPMLLLEAFLGLKEKNIGLIIAGNGELESELKKRAEGAKNISFLGFQNQKHMPILYRVANVFVLPSSGPGETWGLAVNEAMACGRAVVVSTKCGCAIDIVNQNGFVFEAGNKEQLAAILKKFVDNPELAAQMGRNSKVLIEQWNFTVAAQKIEEAVCH